MMIPTVADASRYSAVGPGNMSFDNLAGHAHPVAVQTASQSVADICADLGIALRLRDVLGSRRRAAVDMYCPDVRRSPITRGSPSHLDVVMTWKGLTLARASELLFWEETFLDVLEEHIEEVMVLIFEEHIREHQGMHRDLGQQHN